MIENLLRAESLAARIEAACRAEPELGRLWRAESAIAEAIASVGLEGVRIGAEDLLPRVAFNGRRVAEAEAADAERAIRALRILKDPGDPLRRPLEYLDRIETLSGSPGLGHILERAEEGRGGTPRLDEDGARRIMEAIRPDDPPILGAIRAAAASRAVRGFAEPVVERAIFAAVEGALREAATSGRMRGRRSVLDVTSEDDLPLRGLSEAVGAGWVALPGLALTRGAFRAWDPTSRHGIEVLLEGLVRSLGHDLGRLIPLRAWLERVEAAGQGRTGRSRLADAARLFAERPVMTARDLADRLGITPRGAMNLAAELVELGLLAEVTHRTRARIWATPEIARLLAPRAVASRIRGLRELANGPRRQEVAHVAEAAEERISLSSDPGRVAREWAESKAGHEARLERVYGDLDAALARADRLLGAGSGPGPAARGDDDPEQARRPWPS